MRSLIIACSLLLLSSSTASSQMPYVQTNIPYTYDVLLEDITKLNKKYKELKIIVIGHSHFGRKIHAIKIGKGKKRILLIGAHHGREWITSTLLMKMTEMYSEHYRSGKNIGQYDPKILDEVSIWIVPMLNPDGVSIQQGQLPIFSPEYEKQLMYMNEYSNEFTRWKANGVGLDLNRQYPPGWEQLSEEPNRPFWKNYKGKKPMEAKEVKVMVEFTEKLNPLISVSYHTAGREIFWHYKNGKETIRDQKIAEKVSKLTGYKLSKPPKKATGGGFTDWFITHYDRPGMTIELCPLSGETNPPLSYFSEEWKRNQLVGIFLATEAYKVKLQ